MSEDRQVVGCKGLWLRSEDNDGAQLLEGGEELLHPRGIMIRAEAPTAIWSLHHRW